MHPSTRSKLKQNLLTTLYHKPKHYYKKELQKIVAKNNMLHNVTDQGNSGSILYKSKVYKFVPRDRYVYTKLLPAHTEIITRLEEYVKESVLIQSEYQVIDRFLSLALTFCRHTTDLEAIFGTTICDIFGVIIQDMDGEPRTEKEISAYVTINQYYLKMINERYMHNVIMQRKYDDSNTSQP